MELNPGLKYHLHPRDFFDRPMNGDRYVCVYLYPTKAIHQRNKVYCILRKLLP